VNEKQPTRSSFPVGARRFAVVVARLQAVSIRGRLVAWLLMFISAYRLGMPILFSAALAGLPWLLLPPVEVATPPHAARRISDRATRR
jgi:hypothetical protein